MTCDASRLREAIIARLDGQPWLPVKTVRRRPRPQLQDESLPALFVVFVSEIETPDGEPNMGPPAFMNEVTIGISVVIGETIPDELDDLDEVMDRIRRHLLTDLTFVRGIDRTKAPDDPERAPPFEAVTKVQRGSLFPQDGAAYVEEGRLEISFLVRTAYEPEIPDDYDRTVLTARLVGTDPASPAVRLVIDQAQ